MVTVELSKDEKLVLPESLGRSLGLREGDRVEVRRQDDVLWLQRKEMSDILGPLTDLSRIVSSSRPVGSVDVEKTWTSTATSRSMSTQSYLKELRALAERLSIDPRIRLVGTERGDLSATMDYMDRYACLPRDAMHLAVMARLGIEA
jgi:bifunctional DNA-binding transcriptional regulator/antitoxin component of YhaV-PrlF toxin-antitoxin module